MSLVRVTGFRGLSIFPYTRLSGMSQVLQQAYTGATSSVRRVIVRITKLLRSFVRRDTHQNRAQGVAVLAATRNGLQMEHTHEELEMPLNRPILGRKRRIQRDEDLSDESEEMKKQKIEEDTEKRSEMMSSICDLIEKNIDLESELANLKKRLEEETSLRKECQANSNIFLKAEATRVFPLLSLPNEIITHIFSFLLIKDRMRARVNKRLDRIELESKYSIEHLTINAISSEDRERVCSLESIVANQKIVLFNSTRSYWSDCIRRILSSTSPKTLVVQIPFLALPNEIINRIFSFFVIEYRVGARVNQRQNGIELDSKYFVEKLHMMELSSVDHMWKCNMMKRIAYPKMHLFDNVINASECVRRILRSTPPKILSLELSARKQHHYEIFHMIEEFNLERLEIQIEKPQKNQANTIMDDSFFLGLSRSCKFLSLEHCDCGKITSDGLHRIYKNMINRSTNLLETKMTVDSIVLARFLNAIGITYSDGLVMPFCLTSNRNIEAYRRTFVHIFDGNLEIMLSKGSSESVFSLKLHDTQESLKKAKNVWGFIRIDHTPM